MPRHQILGIVCPVWRFPTPFLCAWASSPLLHLLSGTNGTPFRLLCYLTDQFDFFHFISSTEPMRINRWICSCLYLSTRDTPFPLPHRRWDLRHYTGLYELLPWISFCQSASAATTYEKPTMFKGGASAWGSDLHAWFPFLLDFLQISCAHVGGES